MRSAWLAFLPLVAACSSFEEVRVVVPVPAEARSLLLLYEEQFAVSSQTTRTLYALEVDDPSPVEPVQPFVDDDRAAVTAIFLDIPLEETGFSKGELPMLSRSDAQGRERSISLSAAVGGHVIDAQRFVAIAGGGPGTWTSLDMLPDDYLDLCPEFEAERTSVPTCLPTGFAIRLAPDRVLVWSVDQRFFEISFDASGMHPTPVPSPAGLVRAPVSESNCAAERTALDELVRPDPRTLLSALNDDSGRIWYGGVGRLYFSERYGQTPIELEIPPKLGEAPDLFGFIAGKTDLSSPEFELFAMSLDGRIVRLHRVGTSTVVEEIFDYDPHRRLAENFGGLSYDPASGVLVAAIASDERVIRYENGGVREDHPITGTGYTVARFIEGVGHVIGGDMGFVLRTHPEGPLDGWQQLRLTGTWSARVEGLAPYQDGLLIGGVNGFVAQYRRDFGFCPARQVASQTPRWIIDVGVGHFTVGGHSIADSATPLNLLRRVD